MKFEKYVHTAKLFFVVLASSLLPGNNVDSLFSQTVVSGGAAQEQLFALENVRAITDGSKSFIEPVWSPDGTMIACKSDGIWIMDTKGGNLRQVNGDYAELPLNWLPDSEHIMYRIHKTNRISGRLTGTVHIRVANIRTGESKTLYSAGSAQSRQPLVTSDGNVWVRNVGERKNYVFDVDGNEITGSMVEKVVFTTIENGRRSLIVSNIDGTNEQVITHEPAVNYVLSPDRTKLCFNYGTIKIFDLGTNSIIDLGRGSGGNWSPDGKLLIYFISLDDGHYITGSDIYVIKADGTGKTQLTFTPDEFEMNPTWSPDGKRIVFNSENSGKLFIADFVIK